MSVTIRALFAGVFALALLLLGVQGAAQAVSTDALNNSSSGVTQVTSEADVPLEIDLTNQNVDQTLEHSKLRPLVVVFSQDCGCGECPSCNPVKKILQDLVKKDEGKWSLATVDSRKQPELAKRFAVTERSAVLVVKNTEVSDREASPRGETIAEWVREKTASLATDGGLPLEVAMTGQNAAEVLEHSRARPLVVVFAQDCNCGDPNCPSCNSVKKALQELVKKDEGRWGLATVDPRREPELAKRFQVSGPTAVLVVRNTEVSDREASPRAESVTDWVRQRTA